MLRNVLQATPVKAQRMVISRSQRQPVQATLTRVAERVQPTQRVSVAPVNNRNWAAIEITTSILGKAAMFRMERIKQGDRSVENYAAEFKELVQHSAPLEQQEKTAFFCQGLRDSIRARVIAQNPETLGAAANLAWEAEQREEAMKLEAIAEKIRQRFL